jgi:uroporphyrinogen decarboxylase
MNDRFLRACRREPVDCTPIWLMRQAGRYMAEYRELRARYSMLEMVQTPELAAEVTMQPLRRFDLDAAIIFADILPILIGAGAQLSYAAGEGPVIANPVRTEADVDALQTPPPEENAPYTLAAIRLVAHDLSGRLPLIGFAGAPFTLASYLIEGSGSRDLKLTKRFMYEAPDAWHRLMEKLARLAGEYLAAQAVAGAQALQLFDSWVGALSPDDYRTYVLPYSRRAIELARATGAPVIHFSTGTTGMLDVLAAAGGDVIGIDWRTDLNQAWAQLGPEVALQGNLDPVTLLAPVSVVQQHAGQILARAAGHPGHIFNLGHGVLPETPVDTVSALIDFVHNWQQTSDQ